jgi:predicted CxxxxCH...CXXCH cytochrome family protein
MAYDFGQGSAAASRCTTCHLWREPQATTSCTGCHNYHAPDGSLYAPEIYIKHVNGRIDISFNPVITTGAYNNGIAAPLSKMPRTGYSSCTATYCHSNGTSVSTSIVTSNSSPIWGSGTMGCNGCHGNPPGYANGTPKTNSHGRHNFGCNSCHSGTTADGTSIASKTLHVNKIYDLSGGAGASFIYTFSNSGGSCNSISCHGNTSAQWGSTSCLGCHSVSQGGRAAITGQFGANSHHIQGTVTDAKCYQCHWEANSDGSINAIYHGGAASPGSAVDLVIYGAANRPGIFTTNVTAVQYSANNSRSEITKVTSHCLGCHSDQNNAAQPFGDGKTPRYYAWDSTSVAARYSQSGKATWGKYSTVANAAQKRTAKAYSAHGNAAANKRGWDTTNGVDGAITDTSSSTNVQCFDCHNSHGSTVDGVTTRYASATTNGGILKDTTVERSGAAVAYKPYSGGSAANKNKRNPGASLCLDCHMNQNATTTPWGYNATYGASQAILGYFDAPMYSSYSTAGAEQRYPFKKVNPVKGGHFGASSPLTTSAMSSIGGLCTPCHDPHGVSPTLGTNQQYAVPLLKGTFLTSPYKEDTAPLNNGPGTVRTDYGLEGAPYHIDQGTFASGGVKEPINQSAGLCIGCHPQNTLTNGTTHTWRSKERVHEAVKGWKTANGTIKHNYSCSKCHSAHNSSVLPRLMVTNCLDGQHKGRTSYNPSPAITGSGSGDESGCYGMAGYSPTCATNSYLWASGSGRIPGYYYGGDGSNNQISCHEGNTGVGTDQSWNQVTLWNVIPPPGAPTGISATSGNTQVTISWSAGTGSTSSLIRYGTASGVYGTTIDPAASPQTITSLTNGAAIYYQVGAKNSAGTTWSTEYSVTPATSPTVTSPTATAVASTTATLGANVTSNGGSALTANGTCWGLAVNPATNCLDQGSHVTGVFSQSRTGLTEGSLIYYRGYATNSAGTAYSSSGSIYTEPTQPNTLSFTGVGGGGITVNWVTGSSGNAKNVIVVMRSGSAVNSDPVDGVTYTANAAFGSGSQIGTLNYVVYKGTGTSVAVTGLSPGTTYYVKVYAFAAGATGTENYNVTSPLAGSQATSAPTAPVLTSPAATLIGSTTATLGANVTSNGGAAINERGTVWGTTANPLGNVLAEGGTTTGIFTHARTGLTAGAKIYYRGYATNSAGTGYSPDGSFYTEPLTQASGMSFSAVGQTGMTVSWTRGTGDGVIVLMKLGSTVNSDPVDGTYTAYSASAVFGSGTQIGTGNYVVYKGTGTSVALTGLAASTTYYLAVYEYSGSIDTSGVNQGTNYKPTPLTGSQITSPGPPAAPTLSGPYSGYYGQVGYSDEYTPLTLLEWNAAAGATEYWCEVWSPDGGGSSSSGWTTGLSHNPGDLPDNYDYYWHVKARNASGESGWSETWSWFDEW